MEARIGGLREGVLTEQAARWRAQRLAQVASIGVLAAVLLGLNAAPSLARSCGSLRATYRERGTTQYVQASSIQGEGLRCPRARHVAWDWARKSRLSGNPARTGAGFRCFYHRMGTDVGSVTCRWRRMTVWFDTYDSSGFH